MCYLAEQTGSQNSCQLNMRRILIVRNYAHTILLYCYYTIFMSLYLYNFTYTCLFVSALSDPTNNSERSANGGNKQILYCTVWYCIVLYCICIVLYCMFRKLVCGNFLPQTARPSLVFFGHRLHIIQGR